MIPDLNIAELKRHFDRVVENDQNGLNGLETFQIRQLRKYARAQNDLRVRICIDKMEGQPDFQYPDEYKNGREYNYHQERDAEYKESVFVIDVIDKFLNRSKGDMKQEASEPEESESVQTRLLIIDHFTEMDKYEEDGKQSSSESKETPEPAPAPNPEIQVKAITIKPDSVKLMADCLKAYIQNKKELRSALKGNRLKEKLYFEGNQNRLVELFKRAKYNNHIESNSREIGYWICENFLFKNKGQVQNFNPTSVYDILTKYSREPTKKNRICTSEFPYMTSKQRKEENFE